MSDKREKKAQFAVKVQSLCHEYRRCLIVDIDCVPSNMMQKVRLALNGKGVVLGGKNTLIRWALSNVKDVTGIENLSRAVRLNVALIFTNEDLKLVRTLIGQNKLPAPAKVGQIAPLDVIVPKGNTGLEPTQTTFLQALNIATKINKGTIEILNDVHLIKVGAKVGGSESTLLSKLNIKPFFYEMKPVSIYDNGSVFPIDILDITDAAMMSAFAAGVQNVASVALQSNLPILPCLPFLLQNAFRNCCSIAFATKYEFPQATAMKTAAAAAPVAAAPVEAEKEVKKPAKEAKPAKEEKPAEEEEDLGMVGGMFD